MGGGVRLVDLWWEVIGCGAAVVAAWRCGGWARGGGGGCGAGGGGSGGGGVCVCGVWMREDECVCVVVLAMLYNTVASWRQM